MKNNILTCFVFSIIIVFNFLNSAASESESDNLLVKLNVLSKQIRLLREGSLQQINCEFPKQTIVINERNNTSFSTNAMSICNKNGNWEIDIEDRSVIPPFQYRIENPVKNAFCTIFIQKEKRRYPLPITITTDQGSLRIHTWERLGQYASDSAAAEYGKMKKMEQEAVRALAHIIVARYNYLKREPRHKNFDFCDLTHCQVYRGRINDDIVVRDHWIINDEMLRHNLFFHSRCGGHTFSIDTFDIKMKNAGLVNCGVRDWLYHSGLQLCNDKKSRWTRTINIDDLKKIIATSQKERNTEDITIRVSKNPFQVAIKNTNRSELYSPETIRLMINRVRGWNFIRSNNYTVEEKIINGKRNMTFQGYGLGHGVGLCQYGALYLSRLGYSRYEILEHYFPDISLKERNNVHSDAPYLSYCIFDVSTGSILSTSHGECILNRKIPPGSVFKTILALYLAKDRQDLFNDYTYTCDGNKSNDANLPDHCWKLKGHGNVKLIDALSHSCNLYFASLYSMVSYKDFKKFFISLCQCLDIKSTFPEITNDEQWSRLLAGLDFRIHFTVRDYIKLARLLYADTADNIQFKIDMSIHQKYRLKIFQGLKKTFIEGTASGKIKPYGSPLNYKEIINIENKELVDDILPDMWGKTATVIDGTNYPTNYGLFIGGCGGSGIIVILRKGNGHLAARWALVVLSRYIEK